MPALCEVGRRSGSGDNKSRWRGIWQEGLKGLDLEKLISLKVFDFVNLFRIFLLYAYIVFYIDKILQWPSTQPTVDGFCSKFLIQFSRYISGWNFQGMSQRKKYSIFYQ